jgi:flagellar hook-length control protein FliK
MQAIPPLDVMQSAPEILDTRTGPVTHPSNPSKDFASVLAQRYEDAPARDQGLRQTNPAAREPQSSEVQDHQDESTQEDVKPARDASAEAELPQNLAASLALIGVNAAPANPSNAAAAKSDATVPDPDNLAVVLVASADENIAAQNQNSDMPLSLLEQVTEPLPNPQPQDSTPVTAHFLQAMSDALKTTGEDAAAAVQAPKAENDANAPTLAQTSSPTADAAAAVQAPKAENDVNAPTVTQTSSLTADAATVQKTSSPPLVDAPDEMVDLGAWLKTIAQDFADKPSEPLSRETTIQQPLGGSPKLAYTDKDAEGSDMRVSAAPAQVQDALAAKPASTAPTQTTEQATLAALDKLALQSVRLLVSSGEKTLTVQLAPPSLGELRIEISTVKDTLNVSLISGNEGVRDVLQGHAPALREALMRNGIELVNVAVLPALAGHPAAGQNTGHAPPNFQQMTSPARFASLTTAESEPSIKAMYTRAAPHDGTLNLFV